MIRIIPSYLEWHYRQGGEDVRILSKNIIWFLWNFFSIGLLLKTLFSPWQRLEERAQKRGIQAFFEALVITTMMRLVGAFIRTFFILFGLFIVVIASVLALCFVVIWYALPLIILILTLTGIFFIFHRP